MQSHIFFGDFGTRSTHHRPTVLNHNQIVESHMWGLLVGVCAPCVHVCVIRLSSGLQLYDECLGGGVHVCQRVLLNNTSSFLHCFLLISSCFWSKSFYKFWPKKIHAHLSMILWFKTTWMFVKKMETHTHSGLVFTVLSTIQRLSITLTITNCLP